MRVIARVNTGTGTALVSRVQVVRAGFFKVRAEWERRGRPREERAECDDWPPFSVSSVHLSLAPCPPTFLILGEISDVNT